MGHFLSATSGRTKSGQQQLTSNSNKESNIQNLWRQCQVQELLTLQAGNKIIYQITGTVNYCLFFVFSLAISSDSNQQMLFCLQFLFPQMCHPVSLFHAYRLPAPFWSGLVFSPHEQNLISTSQRSCSLFFDQTYAKRLYRDLSVTTSS